ncbi:MAG: hypothetical protein U0572_15595 [Phycisphaerales bacterium]
MVIGACAATTADAANVWYVDANGPAQGDGQSWATSWRDLQSALAVAANGDEIRIADGTYRPTSGTNRAISFVLTGGVTLYGGYAGLGAANPDARDVVAFPTILSGNIGNAASSSDNSYHVVRADGLAPASTLDGLTIRDGAATSTLADARGGGITMSGGALAIRSCVVRNCSSLSGGSGIYATGAITIENTLFTEHTLPNTNGSGYGAGLWADGAPLASLAGCTFSASSVNGTGGALAASSTTIVIANCLMSGCNSSERAGGVGLDNSTATIVGTTIDSCYSTYFGGGMYVTGGAVTVDGCAFSLNGSNQGGGINAWPGSGTAPPFTVTNSTFTGNGASYYGGGMHVLRPIAVRNCQFINNNAAASGSTGLEYGGGGVAVDGDVPAFNVEASFVDCVFKDNTAPLLTSGSTDAVGGGVRVRANTLFQNCRFLLNNARRGGGIELGANSKATLVNCEFSGNVTKVKGGAIFNDGGWLSLVNSTVANNSAVTGATGAGVVASGNSPYTRIANSILWGNVVAGSTSLTAQLLDEAAGSPKVDFCNLQSLPNGQTLGGVGNSGANPMFVLANGPDGVPGTLDDNFTLAAGSPAIDSGANSLVPVDALDLDGNGVTAEFVPIDLVGGQRMRDGGGANGCALPGAPTVDRGARESAGRGAMPVYGDLDGDGVRNGVDLGILLAAWGPCPNACCPADLDGDGLVTSLDLGLLLGLPWSSIR